MKKKSVREEAGKSRRVRKERKQRERNDRDKGYTGAGGEVVSLVERKQWEQKGMVKIGETEREAKQERRKNARGGREHTEGGEEELLVGWREGTRGREGGKKSR